MIKNTRWDIFCQVIDNWGDAGICFRLARQLSQQNIHVRLWMDDTRPLEWMIAPGSRPSNIEILPWQQEPDHLQAGNVIIEAFGCRAPENLLQRLIKPNNPPPVWINLEYLSAQDYVQACHGLPSPQQSGPGKGLTCWFFYPGFTRQTGGLLRENKLLEQQNRFNPHTWLKQQQIPVLENTLRVSLFSYQNQALPQLLQQWQQSQTPIHLLVTPGISTQTLAPLVGESNAWVKHAPQHPITRQYQQLTITWLPFYSQQDFDHLLWSCDINFVRGEDSWIRAIWANKPFIWQPYIQDNGEHLNKLEAFLALTPEATDWIRFERDWANQTPPQWQTFMENLEKTAQHLKTLRCTLLGQPDLVTSLIRFVQEKT